MPSQFVAYDPEGSCKPTQGIGVVSELKGLSVFVASPGGLEEERRRFIDILSQYNTNEAYASGITFIPQGHELAFAGAGRPQELINDQVRMSDYLIVVFWDKWGMATSNSGRFSSGTEEELHVGLECLESPDRPMRDVVVLFKGVSDRQMSDPGEQLQKVLDFRSKLEEERRILYRVFDTTEEFADELRKLLAKWTRDWSTGEPAKATLPPPPDTPTNSANIPVPDADATLLEQAKIAAKRGQITRAHQLYTQATTGPYDREAWTEYIRFLRRASRFGLMYIVADRMIEKARDLDDHWGAAEAFSNIGIAKRSQGQRTAAIGYFDDARDETAAWIEHEGETDEAISMRAFILDNMGLTWRRMHGKMDQAMDAIGEAIELHERVGDVRGQAHGLRNIGVIYAQLGKLDQSLEALQRAEALFREQEDKRPLAMTISALGETRELMGDIDGAIGAFEVALERNTDLGNHQGKSMNLSQLSRAYDKKGERSRAAEFAEACLALNQKTSNPEGLAAALHAMGRVALSRGDFVESRRYLIDAHKAFESLDQPAGIAGTALDMAELHAALGEPSAAHKFLDRARLTLEQSPHYALQAQYRVAAGKVDAATGDTADDRGDADQL